MDLVKELGALALASRLRRLSDHLKSEVSCIYHSCGIDFDDNWFMIGYVLARSGAMTVSEIARRTGLSRPTISTMIEGMVEHGLVSIRTDPRDLRSRRFCLTPDGEETVAALEPVWRAVDDCTKELLAAIGTDCLGAIDRLEDLLDSRSLFSRVCERLFEETDRTGRPRARAE
jgi:DNA-binding MarR family transcriptional regulator